MSNFVQIHWTTGSIDEARQICRYLVQEKLVACANIIPWVESIYTWNNQLETTQESKVILKTTAALYNEVKDVILKNCNFEVPEILRVNIDGGNEAYLNWMESSVSQVVTSS